MTTTTRPLTSVLQAFQDGATNLHQVSQTTGLNPDLVKAAVDHLIAMGRIEAKHLAIGCPGGGCTNCASGHPDGTSGCGAPGPAPSRRGPVLVQLSLRRPSTMP